MKRVLLSALVVGLLAGQASAGLSFTFNKSAALMLQEISHSPSSGVFSDLYLVTTDLDAYSGDSGMRGQVGYMGLLDATKTQKEAWMRIGATSTTSPTVDSVLGTALGTAPTHNLAAYDEYRLFLANDNNSNWWVQLFIETATTNSRQSGQVTLGPGESTTLRLDLTGLSALNNVTAIGFDIGGTMTGGVNPSDPDVFHISAVPVPAASILGLLGLGVAGLKLRKYA